MKKVLQSRSGRLALVTWFVLILVNISACRVSAQADCVDDSDCAADQYCLHSGGIIVRDAVCVDEHPVTETGDVGFDTDIAEDASDVGPLEDAEADVDADTGPQEPDELDPWGDESGDGIPNQYDNCPFHYNPDQTDTSGDGVGDVCDNCPDVANPDQEYSEDNPEDDRGIVMGDACAPGVVYADTVTDTSGDGVADIMDNCPDHHNPPMEEGCICPEGEPHCDGCRCSCPFDIYPCEGCAQIDSSGDGVGDACDNCPNHYNPDQSAAEGNPVDDRGLVMGDACAPQPGNIPICETEGTTFEHLRPNIYISLDISGSMGQIDTSSGQTRMQEALDGLDLIAEALHDQIRFGLGTYPAPDQEPCDIEHLLDLDDYSEAILKSSWSLLEPTGCTPMRAALEDIRDNDRLGQQAEDQFVRAVLLVTDGVPNCDPVGSGCGGADEEAVQNVIEVIEELYAQDVLTFVVGFHIDHPSLTAFAEAGGTEEPFLADEAQELAQAMIDVAEQLGGCDYLLDTQPEDPDKIWVSVDGEYLDSAGYTYDAAQNSLHFGEELCLGLRASQMDLSDIEIEMGCAVQCVPEQPQGLCDLWYETCGEELACDSCEPEICDGQDNNCSGVVDDGCPECGTYQAPCEITEDCCEPFVCSDGICDRQCYPSGTSCRSDDDCCDLCAMTSDDDEVGTCL